MESVLTNKIRFKRESPLRWPKGRPRTRNPDVSRFDTPMAQAVDKLQNEIRKLGGDNVLLTMNQFPGRSKKHDHGVAVYFMLDSEMMCMACDAWSERRDNVIAIAKTIEAKRGEARWGATDISTSMAGHRLQLTAAGDWRRELDIQPGDELTLDLIKRRYRAKATQVHPDQGGDAARMQKLNAAFEAAKAELSASA